MKNILYIFLLLFLLLGCKKNKDDRNEKLEKYNEFISIADSLYSNSEYKDAISKLNSAIKTTDTIATAFYKKGDCYFMLKKYKKAEKQYSIAIDIEGKNSKIYKNRAINSFAKNKLDYFKKDIDVYLSNYSTDTNAISYLFQYYMKQNDYKNALQQCNFLIKLYPNSISGYKKRALLNFSFEKYNEAITDFSHINRKFNNNKILSERGLAYFYINKYDSAIVDFSKYLSIDSENYKIIKQRGYAYLFTNKKDKAFLDFQKAEHLYYKQSNFFQKYYIIFLIIILNLLLYKMIKIINKNVYDNNTNMRIYLFYFFTGIFGGHYIALNFKYRYVYNIILFLILIIHNNFEIVSFSNNLELLLFSIKHTLFNEIIFFSFITPLLLDLFLIPLFVNYSNYKYQKSILPDIAMEVGKEIKKIENSVPRINSKFNSLKKLYKI